MQPLKLVLTALAMMSLFACSTTHSTPQTGVVRQPPASCLQVCPAALPLLDGSELSVMIWEYALIDTLQECQSIHAKCQAWHKGQLDELTRVKN